MSGESHVTLKLKIVNASSMWMLEYDPVKGKMHGQGHWVDSRPCIFVQPHKALTRIVIIGTILGATLRPFKTPGWLVILLIQSVVSSYASKCRLGLGLGHCYWLLNTLYAIREQLGMYNQKQKKDF